MSQSKSGSPNIMKDSNITCNILATTSQMGQNCCTHSKSEYVIATTLVQLEYKDSCTCKFQTHCNVYILFGFFCCCKYIRRFDVNFSYQDLGHFLPVTTNNFLTLFIEEFIRTWLSPLSTTTSAHLTTRKSSQRV